MDTNGHDVWAILNISGSADFAVAGSSSAPIVVNSPSMTLGGTAAFTNVLRGGVVPVSLTIGNSGNADLASWSVTSSAAGGSFNPNPQTGGLVTAGSTVASALNYTAPNANGNQTLTLSGTGAGSNTSPVATVGPLNVGFATANVSGATGAGSSFGTALQGFVASGSSYAGLGATVNAGSGNLGTTATIVAGTNGSGLATTVGMAFRTRATDELPGSPLNPPMGGNTSGPGATAGWLISDVTRVTGISSNSDYALQLSYDNSTLGNETLAASNGSVYLATKSGNYWVNAVNGNTGGTNGTAPVLESLNAYLIANPNLATDLGAWGVDVADHEAWAILNISGTADFAVAGSSSAPVIGGSPSMTLSGTAQFTNVLANGVVPIALTVGNSGSASLASYTVTGSAAAGTVSSTSGTSLAASTTTSSNVNYTAPATTGTQAVTLSGSGASSTTSPTATVGPINVGLATAAVSGSKGSTSTFGRPLQGVVAAGAAYAGLSATVNAGTGNLGTVATILAGTNNSGAATTVSMAFRTRAADELPPARQSSPNGTPRQSGRAGRLLTSDVLRLTGMGAVTYTPCRCLMTRSVIWR